MAKLGPEERLVIYRKSLARYEAENSPMAETQRILIKNLEDEIERQKNGGKK